MDNDIDLFFQKEFIECKNSLELIKSELRGLSFALQGSLSLTNHQRQIAQNIDADIVPPAWIGQKHKCANLNVSLNMYLSKLQTRFLLLQERAAGTRTVDLIDLKKEVADPEAFLTAFRQVTASNLKISLEKLELEVKIGSLPE